MAKDGSNRGGARPGAGRKRKKIKDFTPVSIMAEYISDEISDSEIPEAIPLIEQAGAWDCFKSMYMFIKDHGAERFVPKELVEQFALCYARWEQAELEIQSRGLTAPHPTTGAECKSYFVDISIAYSKQVDKYWNTISDILKSCVKEKEQEDSMDSLLTGAV